MTVNRRKIIEDVVRMIKLSEFDEQIKIVFFFFQFEKQQNVEKIIILRELNKKKK